MNDPIHRLQFEAIGTRWQIDIYQPVDQELLGQLGQAIRQRIDKFDKNYSRFRIDSLVTHMSRQAGEYKLPSDAEPLFDLYRKLYDLTGGSVTPLIGQVLSDAGYDASYSLQTGKLTSPPKWDNVMAYDFPKLHLQQPTLLDLGAAGKGYLVDIVGALLSNRGITTFCVDAGGDILYRANLPAMGSLARIGSGMTKASAKLGLAIGLEHPADSTLAIGVATIHNQSLCGSAGNRRAWGKYHHIINPLSLTSPHHIQAIWVVADSALLADGLTTALFFTSARKLLLHFDFEYAIMLSDNSLQRSVHFPAKFYS